MMKRIAVVTGGWHWPMRFYRGMTAQFAPLGWDTALFVVAHRSPELAIVREEKERALAGITDDDALAVESRKLYAEFPTIELLTDVLCWRYQERPNTIGDWGFFNQWLDSHDWRQYDVVLNCHDDTLIRSPHLLSDVLAGRAPLYDAAGRPANRRDWLVLANGRYPEAPACYLRGSFEFWTREMLARLGGHFDLGNVAMTRTGRSDTPEGMEALSEWNRANEPTREFLVRENLIDRVLYLSPHYRISRYAIEGERGWLHGQGGAPWSFNAGLAEYPL